MLHNISFKFVQEHKKEYLSNETMKLNRKSLPEVLKDNVNHIKLLL